MPSKNKPSFIVRKLKLNDCEEVSEILADVKSFGSKFTNQVMIKIDPNGIFVAQDQQNGKILGVIHGINHNPKFAFIGQFAVRPQYQGLGIGAELMERVMKHIGTERNISLYPVDSLLQFFHKKCGFSIVSEKRILDYSGKANFNHLIKKIDGISISPISQCNLQFVVEYDKKVCNGFDRRVLIEEYSKISETIAMTAIHETTNQVMGYCLLITSNRNTTLVEPLYADNELIAELLIGKCSELLPISKGNELEFNCWDFNEKANALAKKIGLSCTDSGHILFTKQVVEGDLKKIFSVSSYKCYPF